MMAQRMAAWLLLLVQAAAVGWMKGAWAVPCIAAALAFGGLVSPVGVSLTRTRRLEGVLVVALLFAMRWRLAPPNDMAIVFDNGIGLVLAQYLLVLQALFFWVRRAEENRPAGLLVRLPESLPMWLPLIGAAVLAIAGDIQGGAVGKGKAYQVFALAYSVLVAGYFTVSSERIVRRPWAPVLFAGLVLALAVGVSWAADRTVVELRPQIDRLDAFIANPFGKLMSAQSVGFSGRGALGSVAHTKTEAENSVALRIVADREPGYMRGRVFVRFADSRWEPEPAELRAERIAKTSVPLPQGMSEANVFDLETSARGETRALEVWPSTVFPVAFLPLGTGFLAADSDSLSINRHGIAEGEGLLHYADFVPSDAKPVEKPAPLPDLTALPEPLDPRIADLAKDLLEGCTTTSQKIEAVQSYFRREYRYDLGIQIPAGQDPLTYFLVEKPAAHCEYFASGAAVLLRLGGVYCRYVTGFVPSERNSMGGYWIARNRDAHAWVEAYDEQQGWVIVEATPEAGVPKPEEQSDSAWGDYLRFRFHQLVTLGLREAIVEAGRWLARTALALGRWLVLTPAGAAVLVLAVGVLVARRLLWAKRHGRRERVDPAILELQALLATMDKQVMQKGLKRAPYETLNQFADRLGAAPEADEYLQRASEWYRRYARARYGIPSERSPSTAKLDLPN